MGLGVIIPSSSPPQYTLLGLAQTQFIIQSVLQTSSGSCSKRSVPSMSTGPLPGWHHICWRARVLSLSTSRPSAERIQALVQNAPNPPPPSPSEETSLFHSAKHFVSFQPLFGPAPHQFVASRRRKSSIMPAIQG